MHGSDVSRGRQILARFLALAEERLAYLTELYKVGRWQRYFSEAELLKNVREAKEAVAAWTLLVSREALPNNRPVDLSWLDVGRPLPPRRSLMLDVEMPPLCTALLNYRPRLKQSHPICCCRRWTRSASTSKWPRSPPRQDPLVSRRRCLPGRTRSIMR